MFKLMKKCAVALASAVGQVASEKKTVLMGLCVVGLSCIASASATGGPISMGATGTTIAGYVSDAATAGLAIFAGLFGIRVIVRAFTSVAG